MNRQMAIKYRRHIEQAAASLPDEDALDAPEMFPRWRVGMDVVVDERIYYVGRLYRVVQGHTTQAGWEPDRTPTWRGTGFGIQTVTPLCGRARLTTTYGNREHLEQKRFGGKSSKT